MLLASALVGCTGAASPTPVRLALPAPSDELHFLVVGDAGAIARDVQPRVGQAMASACRASPCDLVLYLGDNFYKSGLPEDRDERSGMFASRFLGPYCGVHAPFFAIVGNHDYGYLGSSVGTLGASPGTEVALRQLGYGVPGVTDPAERPVCETGWLGSGPPRWCMPSLDYSVRVGALAGFVGVDTTPLLFRGEQTLVPLRTYVLAELSRMYALPWRFVFAHHPLRSAGSSHGDAGDYPLYEGDRGGDVRNLHRTTACRHADILFTGHDHHLEIRPRDPECGAAIVISGAGGKLNPLRDDAQSQVGDLGRAVSEGGFFDVRVRAHSLDIAMVEVPAASPPERTSWCATKATSSARASWARGDCKLPSLEARR